MPVDLTRPEVLAALHGAGAFVDWLDGDYAYEDLLAALERLVDLWETMPQVTNFELREPDSTIYVNVDVPEGEEFDSVRTRLLSVLGDFGEHLRLTTGAGMTFGW